MTTVNSIRHELNSRLSSAGLVKTHLSIRYEPGPQLVRLGACIEPYTWESRAAVLDRIIEFEADHDEFAVEFDIVPLPAVTDPSFAEA